MSLDAAVEAGDMERVKDLLGQGCQLSPPSEACQSPAQDSKSTRSRAASRGFSDLLKLLCIPSRDAHFSSEQIKADRELCVVAAASKGHLEPVQIILGDERILEEELKDLHSTSLQVAALANHNHIVQYNLQHKANFNIRNHICEDPLMLACTDGYTEIVKSLLDAGAKAANRAPYARIEYNNLWRAAVKGHLTTMQLLLDHGADEQLLEVTMGVIVMRGAGDAGQLDSMQLLFDNGVKINDKWGKDIAKRFIQSGQHDALEVLRRNGVNVEVDPEEEEEEAEKEEEEKKEEGVKEGEEKEGEEKEGEEKEAEKGGE